MNPGDIAIAVIPQDGTRKKRPVLVLQRTPKYNDLLVCAISSQLHQYNEGLDIILTEEHPAFAQSGLTKASVIRVSSVAVLGDEDIEGTIGTLEPSLHQRVVDNFHNFLNDGVQI